MPNMDGFELCKLIKQVDMINKTKSCPVIAVTACVSLETQQKAKEVGMGAVITKPADRELLLAAIRKVFFIR